MANWTQITTKNGYPADEVISALQKDIRRSNYEHAGIWAYELVSTSDELAKKFWERVLTIAVEDIGLANEHAIVIATSCKEAFYSGFENKGDGILHAIFIAIYLAKCEKDRLIDEFKHYIDDIFANNQKPEIPDYALDKHTRRGKEMNRGFKHFIEEGAQLVPEKSNREKKFLQHMAKKLGANV